MEPKSVVKCWKGRRRALRIAKRVAEAAANGLPRKKHDLEFETGNAAEQFNGFVADETDRQTRNTARDDDECRVDIVVRLSA